MNYPRKVMKRQLLCRLVGMVLVSSQKIIKCYLKFYEYANHIIPNWIVISTECFGKRTLFTQDSLGITAYIANRELEFTYTANPEQFKAEFQQKVKLTVPLNLLVDNLKRYVHVFNSNLNEIELLWRALRLFKTQNDQWQRKSQLDKRKVYTFGPIVMRALSYHDIPEYAIKVRWAFLAHCRHSVLHSILLSIYLFGCICVFCLQFFDDSNITEIFDQLATYQILLDLLYDKKMYGDVLRINDEIRKRIAARKQYASSAINAIIFATYYRLVRAHWIYIYIGGI